MGNSVGPAVETGVDGLTGGSVCSAAIGECVGALVRGASVSTGTSVTGIGFPVGMGKGDAVGSAGGWVTGFAFTMLKLIDMGVSAAPV